MSVLITLRVRCTLALASIIGLVTPGAAQQVPNSAALDSLLAAQQRRVAVIEAASAATIAVFGQDGSGGGSGVLISTDGFALTNFHVAAPCGNAMRCGLSDGVLYNAVIVGVDPTGDVALIKLLGRNDFPTAPLGDSDSVQVGQPCFAAGNPFLLATDFRPTITWGIISGVHRYQYPEKTLLEYADCLQTDAAINPGNSGGPLFDASGHLIGINGRISIAKRGRVNVGVGYAISINQIKKFLGHLHSGRIVDHATLGFTVSSAPGEDVVVTNILDTSDAYRRGIRVDDSILSIDNRSLHTANELKNLLGTFPKAWRVPIVVRRGKDEFNVIVRLDGLHSDEELLQMLEGPSAPPPIPRPKPKPKPNPENPEGPSPEEPEPRPAPRPPQAAGNSGSDAMPAEVRKVFAQRRGFANYYFNRLHVQRIHQGLTSQFSDVNRRGPWVLEGQVQTGGPFQIRLEQNKSELELPSGSWSISMDQPLDAQLVPNGSGGLLVTLHLIRDFVTRATETFGEVTYIGTTPVRGYAQPVDITTCLREALELRVYTDPANGQLLAAELFADSRQDPCEIYMQYDAEKNTALPTELEVRCGDEVFTILNVEKFDGGPAK